MRLQISTDYAVRILRHLHKNSDELHTAASIAESVGMTYHFFAQIANQLKKRGLLDSVQGRKGGYQLGRPAQDISLYDVFLCVEGELQISRCLGNGGLCDYGKMRKCKMHGGLRSLQDTVIEEMSKLSLIELAS
ncbi:MAG: Rrf2 family transcriptional regulator [Oscillospiraceae bacterium]|nr:Rrf2 family transcriptional regulator [Oscillospiraceae bacterium]